jgi:hypothetical protein
MFERPMNDDFRLAKRLVVAATEEAICALPASERAKSGPI